MANRQQRRASSAKYPPSLDAWKHDRLIRGMELPGVGDAPNRLVDFEIPDLAALAIQGQMPNPLAAIALRVADGLSLVQLADDDHKPYFDLMCWTIGRQLRKPNLVDELGTEEAAAEWVATEMPAVHRWAIWQRCVHVFDPGDILAAISELDLPKEVRGEDVANVTDLGDFREEPGGVAVPANSGTAGPAPK